MDTLQEGPSEFDGPANEDFVPEAMDDPLPASTTLEASSPPPPPPPSHQIEDNAPIPQSVDPANTGNTAEDPHPLPQEEFQEPLATAGEEHEVISHGPSKVDTVMEGTKESSPSMATTAPPTATTAVGSDAGGESKELSSIAEAPLSLSPMKAGDQKVSVVLALNEQLFK